MVVEARLASARAAADDDAAVEFLGAALRGKMCSECVEDESVLLAAVLCVSCMRLDE